MIILSEEIMSNLTNKMLGLLHDIEQDILGIKLMFSDRNKPNVILDKISQIRIEIKEMDKRCKVAVQLMAIFLQQVPEEQKIQFNQVYHDIKKLTIADEDNFDKELIKRITWYKSQIDQSIKLEVINEID